MVPQTTHDKIIAIVLTQLEALNFMNQGLLLSNNATEFRQNCLTMIDLIKALGQLSYLKEEVVDPN